MKTTKIDRLINLRSALLECKIECVKDADEWQILDDMTKRINELIAEEQHRLGYMAVYHIVNGQATDELFRGTKEHCDIYVDIMTEGHPDMKRKFIIANI